MGGEAGVRALVDRFYERMDTAPDAAVIRKMHKQDLSEMRERLSLFLCGWLGGPRLHFERYGSLCMRTAHAPFPIDREASDAWKKCMVDALRDATLGEATREALSTAFGHTAEMLVNRDAPQ
ncbi:MAG: group II truncated hemoglobin [bacterium]|nr:globin [Deltaproteobacteria bacterium]MCP4905328.1 group II truncated hemoglobin [bacterium]